MNLPSRQSRKPFAERAGGQASSIVADVTDIADVTEIFDLAERDSGRVDMSVQNAGVITIARIDDLPEEDWDKVKAASTKGVFLCCQVAIARIRKHGDGGRKRTMRLLEAAERVGLVPHLLTADHANPDPEANK